MSSLNKPIRDKEKLATFPQWLRSISCISSLFPPLNSSHVVPCCNSPCFDSPVQCCLNSMPQGNTVKKLKAKRTPKENHRDWESQIAKKRYIVTFHSKRMCSYQMLQITDRALCRSKYFRSALERDISNKHNLTYKVTWENQIKNKQHSNAEET